MEPKKNVCREANTPIDSHEPSFLETPLAFGCGLGLCFSVVLYRLGSYGLARHTPGRFKFGLLCRGLRLVQPVGGMCAR